MAEDGVEAASCCRFKMPTIPTKWLLFIDFAFTFGTSIVYLADIITDVVTLEMYWSREWYYAFGFSMGFIIAPSILLAILECQFLIKTYGKNTKWSTVLLRTLLNIPFQLTVIWYHFKLSYNYWRVWQDHIREKDKRPIAEEDRKMSMSNLADLDDRANTTERRAITSKEVPTAADISIPPGAYDGNTDHTWWKQLTREEWLSHLNKMKLTESMLESLPQLLINLYLIVKYTDTPIIQYISAAISYLSLCGGIVRYDKTRKDNEADRLMVDRTLLHSRAFATRFEWPQILFLSLYKGCFLAARILVFVYFTVYFQVYILVFIFIHWAVLMGYLVYLWYPSDLHKKTRELVQADYKFRAYMFLSQDFISVFHNSLVGIFISVRPRNYAFLGQPYCYLFWFYFAYVIENIVLFLLPGVYFSIQDEEIKLVQYQYYIVLIFELLLNVFGAVLCTLYYFSIHKMSTYTRNAYPQFSKLQAAGLCCCCDLTQPAPKAWTVCKQAETSEIFYLRRAKLKEYKSGYTTVVRVDRKRGRNLECFIDERGKIFYAPRGKLFKKLPSHEEEEMVNLRREASRQSLDDIGRETPFSQRPESRSTYRNDRLVGEDPSVVDDNEESRPLVTALPSPPPLPRTPPRASTPVEKASVHDSTRSKRSNQSSLEQNAPTAIPQHLTKCLAPNESARSSKRSSKSHGSNKAALTSELDQGESRPEELQHLGSQRSSPSTGSRPGSSRRFERSVRSNRSPSPKQSTKSDTPPEDVMPTAKEEGQVSSIMPSISPIPNQTVHHGTKSSHRENTKGFSPEGMWKQHKKSDHALHYHSARQKSPQIQNHSVDKSARQKPLQKSRRSPEKGDNRESNSSKRDSERPSRKSQSSKDRHQGSGNSKCDFDIKSQRQNHDDDDDHEVSPMGDPVGQTWI